MSCHRIWVRPAFVILVASALAIAAEAPKGSELYVRLKTQIASNASKAGGAVEAVLIRPVVGTGGVLIPSGVTVRGTIKEAKPSSGAAERAVLAIEFAEISAGSTKTPIAATLKVVENAREGVDANGRIVGILASETITAKMDSGISVVSQRFAKLGGLLETIKSSVVKTADVEIVYEPGTDMVLETTKAVTWTGPATVGPVPGEIPNLNELAQLVTREVYQTVAEAPPKPSDITNLMFIGTEDELKAAFLAAGWNTAASLSAQSKLETFRAITESRGYKEAPMSSLLLENSRAAFDYQKQLNTFASRHHLRIWRRSSTFLDKPVWACAATHDTGIEFSAANRTFIHKIDSYIDRERAKVVSDLIFGGRVKALALVARPAVPKKGRNATGDEVITDGRIAVLLLQ